MSSTILFLLANLQLLLIHLILALSVADQLKTRRRNLVSAKVGIYSFIFMVTFEPFVILLHYIPIEVGELDEEI